jgi:hypothetical protein
MGFVEPKDNPHDFSLCGLEIDGRQLCPACERAAQAESRRYATSLLRRRRVEAVRRALPPAIRRWLRALIRREVAKLRGELPDRISELLAEELPEALDYSLARREGAHNGAQANRR